MKENENPPKKLIFGAAAAVKERERTVCKNGLFK
jgi:hypothetical protein